MWVCLNNSFVSIVQHHTEPALFVVRGRFAGDVAAFLDTNKGNESVTPDNDYRYRMTANRLTVDEALKRATAAINYTNFKDSCPTWRHEVYIRVWSVMHRAQHLALLSRGTSGALKWWREL